MKHVACKKLQDTDFCISENVISPVKLDQHDVCRSGRGTDCILFETATIITLPYPFPFSLLLYCIVHLGRDECSLSAMEFDSHVSISIANTYRVDINQ